MVSKELTSLQNELLKDIPYLKSWTKQNDKNDKLSNFIYNTTKFSDIIEKAKANKLPISYVCHRWYNYHTSKVTENIFEKYGCVKEKNFKHKEIDIYFKQVPYDIKLTVLPSKYKGNTDFKNKQNKDDLIVWYYKNQSQEGRKHLANRLFVVCKSKNNNYEENLKLKCNFKLIEKAVLEFIEYYSCRQLNTVCFEDNGEIKFVYSDIIVVED